MSNEFIKAERVVATALGLLERDSRLAGLVWRDAAGDFRGAKGDTITVRLPAYAAAKKRGLRSGATRTKGQLIERSVDVTLTENLYLPIEITDPDLTLDIESFNRQVTGPVARAILRGIEDEIVAEAQSADYEFHLQLDQQKPHETITRARRHLNDAQIPMDGRALVVGSAVEEVILNSENFVRVDHSGSDSALRRAQIGRVADFDVFYVPGLDPEEAYAFHQTAFVLNQRAPMVPNGAPWGAVDTFESFAIRFVQAIDSDSVVDVFHGDVFVGTNHVKDVGSITNGVFEPAEDPEEVGQEEHFVRAVKIDFDGPPAE